MCLNKVFITLNEICIKSLNGIQTETLFSSLFALIEETIKPLGGGGDNNNSTSSSAICVEVTSLEWIFLFVSRLISIIDKSRELNCRWEFLENIYLNNKSAMSKTFPTRAKSKIKKKLIQSNKYFTWSKIKENRKNLDRYKKTLWKNGGGVCGSSGVSGCGGGSGSGGNDSNSSQDSLNKFNLNKKIYLPHDISLRVGRLIGKLLVSANSYCSSDLFVLSCRILSSICCSTMPAISLCDIFEPSDLNQLILLNVSGEFNHGSVCWGSPWSQHALISLFMDTIENEKAALTTMASIAATTPTSNGVDQFSFSKPLPMSKNDGSSSSSRETHEQANSSKTQQNSSAASTLTNEINLRKIEELDEISIESQAKSPPRDDLDEEESTGKLIGNHVVNDFTQFSEMLSSRIEEINSQSNKIDEELRNMTQENNSNNNNNIMDDDGENCLKMSDANESSLVGSTTTTTTNSNNSNNNAAAVIEINHHHHHKTSEKIIKDLVENIMNKKLDQIKQTMISLPKKISHFNSINSSQLSFNPSNINKKLAQLKNQINLNTNGSINGNIKLFPINSKNLFYKIKKPKSMVDFLK